MLRITGMLMLLVLLGGCFNDNRGIAVRLGNVSIGQQLIDLKAALEQGAMTEEEYARVRVRLIELNFACNDSDVAVETEKPDRAAVR